MTSAGTNGGVTLALLGFARALAAAGVTVTPDRAQRFAEATSLLGAGEPTAVYWAGRATLCSQPDDLAVYDKVFALWFAGRLPTTRPRTPPQVPPRASASLEQTPGSGQRSADDDQVRALASDAEVLRHRDLAELSPAEKARMERMFAGLQPRLPRRATSRRRPAPHGEVDARALLRDQLRRGGEVGPPRWRRRSDRPRRVVMLLDVSGSMAPYADALLRLAHLMVRAGVRTGGRVEVFSMGTRLTRLTPVLRRVRSAPEAVVAAGRVVPDWSGGTRLGEVLSAFVQRWGRRGVARGAVVVICSDGWERGDTALLAEQAEQIARLSHRLVWVNPHSGKHGYRPVQSGIVAALPHLDDFVAGHSLAAFDELLDVVARC